MDKIDSIIQYCNGIVNRDAVMLKTRFGVTNEELSHIAHIGASIVLNRTGLRPGGGFVEAVCENNLISASGRADSTMQKVLAYMAMTFASEYSNISYEATKNI
jgi:hypothetical protein